MQITTKNLIVRKGDQTGDYSCCKLLSSSTFRKSFYCSMVGIAVFLLSLLFSNSCFAYSASLSTSGDIELDITPTSSGATAIAEDELTITSTCPSGYTLYLSGTSDNSLYLEGDNTTTAAPISASSASLANPDLLSPNTWGFSLSSSASSFAGLTDSLVAIKSPTGQASTDESFSVYYAANANLDRVGGTYTTSGNSTTLTYTLMPELACYAFNVHFDAGGGEGSMEDQAVMSGEEVVLSPNEFTYHGHEFRGWSTVPGEDGGDLEHLTPGALYFCGSYCDENPEDGEGYVESIPSNLSDWATITNELTLYAVWEDFTYTIVYGANSQDAEGTMDQTTYRHTSVYDGDTVNLYAPNFSNAGYGFAGWSPVAGTTVDTADGIIYGPNATITAPAIEESYIDSGNRLMTLYAVWVPAETDENDNPVYLQGWMGCSALAAASYDSVAGTITPGSVIALTDNRDGEVYAVAKLTDGRCWLMENLRTVPNQVAFATTNTNNPTSAFISAAPTSTNVNIFPYSTTSANINKISYNINNINRSLPANATTTSWNYSWYSYGVLYNRYTASAGTNGDTNNSMTGDICPAGWSIPSYGNYQTLSSSFGGLTTDMTASTNPTGATISTRFRAFPNNYVKSGIGGDSGSSETNRYGRGGSSYTYVTASQSAGYSRRLEVFGGSVYLGNNNNATEKKTHGIAVRCLAKASFSTYTINYHPNADDVTDMPETTTYTQTGNGVVSWTIPNEVPKRVGFTFRGWTSSLRQPGETFDTASTTANLYAIWQNNACNPSASTIDDAVCLQDVNLSVKADLAAKNAAAGSIQTYTLKDARDNKSYTIALLDDGNVWMTQNLNYGYSVASGLTAYDSDLSSGLVAIPASLTGAFSNSATSVQVRNHSTYGAWYSFAAAIASSTAYNSAGTNVSSSVCPKGWDLPTAAQYSTLISAANLTTRSAATASPYNFQLSGHVSTSGVSNLNEQGYYRTSTVTDSTNARDFKIASADSVVVTGTGAKYTGKSVRCLASNGTASISYDANGGSGATAAQTDVEINSSIIRDNAFTPPSDNYQFDSWNRAADGTGQSFAPGDSLYQINNGESITLYAIWTQNS